jgi:uncharacterized membrane protein
VAQNKEKWWDVEKTATNFPFHTGLMCVIHLILSSVTGVHTFHSYILVASDKLYLKANTKVVVHFGV